MHQRKYSGRDISPPNVINNKAESSYQQMEKEIDAAGGSPYYSQPPVSLNKPGRRIIEKGSMNVLGPL